MSCVLILWQVDNVAGLYAGTRDSALTNHGVDQAKRLGEHMASNSIALTHIFASPLLRTHKTAEAILKAQPDNSISSTLPRLCIVKCAALIEQACMTSGYICVSVTYRVQDFGHYEGKSFQARSSDSKKTGREAHRDKHKSDPGFVDVESKESMAKRVDEFLDEHLLPLFDAGAGVDGLAVAIVSHGMLLSTLWRRLLLRLPRKSLNIAPEVTASRGELILEHLGGWSNTGYLQLSFRKDDQQTESHNHAARGNMPIANHEASESFTRSPTRPATASTMRESSPARTGQASDSGRIASNPLIGYSTTILAIDNKQHLSGLKRQRGGIGRSAHDESQRKLDGFFKKRRI